MLSANSATSTNLFQKGIQNNREYVQTQPLESLLFIMWIREFKILTQHILCKFKRFNIKENCC